MYKIKLTLFTKRLIFIFVLALTGCSARIFTPDKTPIADRSFLTSEICDPPCWYGLEINNSTKEDALSTLNQLPFIDGNGIDEYETYLFNNGPLASEIIYKCVKSNKYPCGILTFYDGKLIKNLITVRFELTLEDAVERLGIPDHLIYFWPNPYGSCEITVTWIKKGVAVIVHDKNNYNECESIIDGNRVSSVILVDTILYTSPEILEENYVKNPGTCCTTIQWAGFKE
jgi:hypothetical protein